jgi:hypothetical protein
MVEGVHPSAMGWTKNAKGKPVFVKGDGAGHEAAVYQVAKTLGLGDYLPHVVLSKDGNKVFVQGVEGMAHPSVLPHSKHDSVYRSQNPEDMQKMAVLDAMAKHNHRFFGGHGFTKDGKIVFTDHGKSFAAENYNGKSLAPSYLAHVNSVTTPEVAAWVQKIDSFKILDMLKKHGVVKDDAHAKDVVEHIEDIKANVKPNQDLKLLFNGRG